ncbi:MAG: 16S rRNA (uracil(1498)-N(3))-methyltransferase [Thermomonas sp.]|uniref:16S rRNA (uracil(1498)-N(3))-methyltransferase n=1 Tax=Thermomonas sp. TaxID=1971895 RepID=UPI001B628081|nr:16S rRNA (uracil(1498)-N(3))-methyltransferase [Thermomonas sp.]MBP7157548.1 16S rRNA (uracil(1498)-N(3))-methyltransferase [Thermomonas sp.]MBP7788285.1 16S rRNA (uracil(1498)-N(3))-methyltransferase [Thermomonas sp.]MBP8614774.1 16S rRNA (uracil(1498)-N(3))-methyltransferase [Thermomonas sp.]MBP8647016.1 16S rRNA (uracil(1498)-N(3))-methyltransferase [Thermomonas sp.]
MRLTRSHVDLPLRVGEEIALPEDVAAHLLRVLRLQVGDACVLFNGDGHDYDARITAVGKRDARASVLAARRVDNESPLRISLLQGIARGEKMDWILQKATELGVARILPACSERSEVRLDAQRAEKRLAHWRGILVSACEQSGRASLPEIVAPCELAQAAGLRAGPGFILDPEAGESLTSLRGAGLRECTLAIGPEGGWSPRDRERLLAAGYTGLRLGPRVLRTETAGIAAIAALQALCGDLG